jgi:SAM-dependent methyltransferase
VPVDISKTGKDASKGPDGRCSRCAAGMRQGGADSLGRVRGYELYRCAACALTFLWPKPAEAEIARLYSTYHAKTGQLQLSSEGERGLFRHVVARIKSVVGLPAELLDIGASYGHFLATARDAGFFVKGIEIAASPAQSAREHFHLDIDETTLEQSAFTTGRFKAVTLLNVLEHLPDPFATLRECLRVSQAGGVVVIVVPNLLFAYPYFRATRTFGAEWPVPTSAYDVPFHLSLFSPASLRRLLMSSGWEVVSIEDAPVIRNANPVRTLLKQGVHSASRLAAGVSGRRLLMGYSQIAVARKPAHPTSPST